MIWLILGIVIILIFVLFVIGVLEKAIRTMSLFLDESFRWGGRHKDGD